jgi:hypothetical protein
MKSLSHSQSAEESAKETLLAVIDLGRHNSVGELVKTVSRNAGLPKSVVAKTLYRIGQEGTAQISEPPLKGGLFDRFFSTRNLKFWVLLTIPLATGYMILGSVAEPLVYFRYVLGSLTVLLIPGMGVIDTLYSNGELSSLQEVVYSVAISFALIPAVGMVLNYSPWGFSLRTIFVSFFVLDVFLALISSIRRNLAGEVSEPPGKTRA